MKKTISLILASILALAALSAAMAEDAEAFYLHDYMPLIRDARNFCEGYAWIWYNDENSVETVSAIDTRGNILFTLPEKQAYVSDFHEGTAFYTVLVNSWDVNANRTDVLIDAQGNELYRTEGDDYGTVKWERIFGYANGYYILMRQKSGITAKVNEIAFMRPDGTLAIDYTSDYEWEKYDQGEKNDPFAYIRWTHDVGYAGYGWYWVGETFIHPETKKLQGVSGTVISDFGPNQKVVTSTISGDHVYDLNFESTGRPKWYATPEKRALMTDHMYYSTNDRCYYDLDYNEILSVKDLYPDNKVKCSPFYGGDLALMEIEGADGRKYLTMIDRQGQQMFEPIAVKSYYPEVMDGYAIVAPDRPDENGKETEQEEYWILDSRGKLCHCVSDDFGWRELKIQNGAFSSGEHTFREGWFLLEYNAGTRNYYRFYPVKYAVEQGDSWCNVGFLDEDELSEAAGQ